jgi:hypothetical protein
MMQDVLAAFPRRPLQVCVPGPGVWGNMLPLFGAALLLLGAILLFGWAAPELAQDWLIRDNARPAPHGRLVDTHCTEKLFIDLCDLTLSADVPGGGTIEREVHYLFANFSFEDLSARVLADPNEPTLLTTDLGLDRLVNRTVMMAAAAVLTVLGLLGGVKLALARGQRRAALQSIQGQVLTPLELALVGWKKTRTTGTWTVRTAAGARQVWSVPAKAKPLLVAPGRVLGVVGPQREMAVPLDAALQWLDLTDAERQRIWSAVSRFGRDTGGVPVTLEQPPPVHIP